MSALLVEQHLKDEEELFEELKRLAKTVAKNRCTLTEQENEDIEKYKDLIDNVETQILAETLDD